MPGNEIAENIHNFFEQGNSSQSQQSQVVGGTWPVLNNNPWVGAQRQNGMPLTFNSKNYISQCLDSEQGTGRQSLQTPFGTNLTQLPVKPEALRSQPKNQQLNLNGFMHGSQVLQGRSNQGGFLGDGSVSDGHSLMQRGVVPFESQQGNAPGYRSEVTEAPVSFDFLGCQQQSTKSHAGASQPHPRQQQGVNDMQLWQQHLMFKQLQEIQRQQQLQQLDQGGRQQNSLNQLPGIARQATTDQIPALLSGLPIIDASNWSHELVGGQSKLPNSSHLFLSGNMNWANRSGSPMQLQGVPNGLMFDQGQVTQSTGLFPQQPDQSLYGTPVARSRGLLNNYSQYQATPHDFTSPEAMVKAGGNQSEKTSMHPSAFNYFQSDQSVVPDQGYLNDDSVAKQGMQGRSVSGSASVQGVRNGTTRGNFQQVNHLSQDVQVQEIQDRQEQADWSGKLPERVVGLVGPTQAVTNLDPTEEKLLFSADDDGNHDVSFGGSSNRITGANLHSNPIQNNDYFGAFPSMQSGSWSALMQEAVEASSSDTGLNEEWSGLSFQKTELSPGNHSTVLNDNGRQQATWNDSNLQTSSSLTSRPFPLFNNADLSPDCRHPPNLQQPIKLVYEQNERLSTDAFHESFQQSSKGAHVPFDQSHLEKQYVGGRPQTQMQFNGVSNGVWAGQLYELPSATSAHSADVESNSQNMQHVWNQQQKMPLQSINSQPSDKLNDWNTRSLAPRGDNDSKYYVNNDAKQHVQRNDIKKAMHMERDHDGSMWKVGDTPMAAMSFPNSAGGPESIRSDFGSPMVRHEDSSMSNLAAVMNSNTSRLDTEINQQILNRHQASYGKNVAVDSFVKNIGDDNVAKNQNHLSSSPQAWDSSVNNTDTRPGETWDHKQENRHPTGVPNEDFVSGNSHPGQNTNNRGVSRENSLLTRSDPRPSVSSSQKSSGQSGRKTVGPRRFQYHPMGNIEMNAELVNSQNYTSYSQGRSQPVARGLQHQEQGFAGHTRFSGHVVSNAALGGKGNSVDLKSNARVPEETHSRGTFSNNASGVPSFDGSTAHFPQNKRTSLASENMLELLHKVDQSRDRDAIAHFTSDDNNTPSEIAEAAASDGSASSALQGYGLKLAPPSQRQSIHVHNLPSQTSLQRIDDSDQRNQDSGAREKDHMWSSSTNSVISPPPAYEASQRENLGRRSRISGKTSKEATYSHFQENSPAATASTFPMNHFVMQNREQQQQQQQQQQHSSCATGSATSDQSANVKQSSHPRQTQESHDGVMADKSAQTSLPSVAGRIPPPRHTPSADTCSSVASQSYPVNPGHFRPINASSHQRSSGKQLPVVEVRPVIQPSSTSGVSQQGGFSTMLHNVWTSVSNQQRLSGVQPQKIISNVLQSMSPLPSNRSSNSQGPQKAGDESKTGGNSPSEFGACSVNLQQITYGEEHSLQVNTKEQMPSDRVDAAPSTSSTSIGQGAQQKHHSDENSAAALSSLVRLNQQDLSRGRHARDSSSDTHRGHVSLPSVTSSHCDPVAYGHNLNSSDVQNHNYSLLQQMQAMKGADSDPSKRAGKRLKGANFSSDPVQKDWAAGQRFIYGQNTVFRELDATSPQNSFSSDVKMLSFSSRESEEKNANSSLQVMGSQIPSHDQLTSVQRDLQNQAHSFGKSSSFTVMGGSERPQISPQMAPSWFEQYGTYKNGQNLTTYDELGGSQRTAKAAALQYSFSKEIVDSKTVVEQRDDASQVDSPPNVLGANEHLSSHSLSLGVIDNNMALMPKKRKSATSDLLPWHKEIAQGCQRLRSISMAEMEWAQATNRLIEKVEDDFEMIEDGLPIIRSRRRLILTTQLMQQLFPSVPATFLTDATASYESVIYFIAKLTLGDACSLTSCSGSDSRALLDRGNMLSERFSTPEKVGDNLFSKVVEDFLGRSRKLESDFLRLDRRASILDVRLECQDLERCSIINRFAKFHGRVHSDGVESSSTSETAFSRRTFPQGQVTALTMPRNLPEGVLCLSL